jgi:23S rRNA (uracil1939-C5)-methyltransferase
MLIPGQELSLTIEKPAVGGAMIARADGQIVLVTGAIPGERIRSRIIRVNKSVAYADAVQVEEASPDRRHDAADPLCGGCLYAHIAYARQLELKSLVIADAFSRIARLSLPASVQVMPSREDGYRMRARLHVRGSAAGFFREGTHSMCDARITRQLLPSTCDAIDRVLAAARSVSVDVIREIELSENVDASERVVAIVAASAIDAGILERIANTDGFTGLVSDFGSFGESHVVDRLAVGADVIALHRDVRAFFQGNRHLLADFVTRVVAHVPEHSELLDLYAGVGLFAIGAARTRRARVTAVEGDRYAAADLALNALPGGGATVAVHQSVEQFVSSDRRAGWSTVIVDPPRTGMSREALDGVLRFRASTVLYVSCDVATLARDARRLVDGGYEIAGVEAFDLFPNTPHVETVVVFQRSA